MKELETENNRLWIDAYRLQNELDPNAPEEQITLARPDKEKDVKRLISYAVGCMMGGTASMNLDWYIPKAAVLDLTKPNTKRSKLVTTL